MRVLCLNAPVAMVSALLALGVEVETSERFSLQVPLPDPEPVIPPEVWAIHRDQPAPNRAAVIPAHMLRRPKR